MKAGRVSIGKHEFIKFISIKNKMVQMKTGNFGLIHES